MAGDDSGDLKAHRSMHVAESQKHALAWDENDDRPLVYFTTMVSVRSIDLVSHTFCARGYVDMFWQEPGFAARMKEELGVDVALGSVADLTAYQMVLDIKDDGHSLPINPKHMFGNLEKMNETAPPKVMARRGAAHSTAHGAAWHLTL